MKHFSSTIFLLILVAVMSFATSVHAVSSPLFPGASSSGSSGFSIGLPFPTGGGFPFPGGGTPVPSSPSSLTWSPFACPLDNSNIAGLLQYGICTISRFVIPLLILIALVVFLWGGIQFIANAEDAEKRAKGRQFLIWGLVALFVMTSVWGLVRVLASTFGIGFVIPQLPS